ncbi:MAG: TolC family protein [Sulfurimonas sp.]|nr:TolC family protein [Sulfurimonas sp.]
MKAFIPLLCLPLFLYSQTLEELVEISHKNRVVEAASFSINAKEKAYESTKSSYLPSIDLGASYLNTYKERATSAKNTLKASAKLQYIIYDGGKKDALYEQLLYNVDAGKENLEAVKNSISLDVTRLYFAFLSLNADKDATNQEIKELEAELKRLEMFYTTGSVTRDEVDKIDSRLKNANVVLNEIELGLQKVLYTLEYYTTQEIQTIESGSSVHLGDAQTSQTRPDIKVMELEAQALLSEAQSKKSENLPTLYFDNTYSYSDYYFDDKSYDTGFLVTNQNVASLNASWNVFDFGATTQAYESKQYEYLAQKSTLEYEKNRADIDYRLAKKELELSKQKIDATNATLDAASATYELIKLKYQNGTIDNVAYLQALSEKFSAQRGYERAKNDCEVKKAEVLFYSGHTIKEYL